MFALIAMGPKYHLSDILGLYLTSSVGKDISQLLLWLHHISSKSVGLSDARLCFKTFFFLSPHINFSPRSIIPNPYKSSGLITLPTVCL